MFSFLKKYYTVYWKDITALWKGSKLCFCSLMAFVPLKICNTAGQVLCSKKKKKIEKKNNSVIVGWLADSVLLHLRWHKLPIFVQNFLDDIEIFDCLATSHMMYFGFTSCCYVSRTKVMENHSLYQSNVQVFNSQVIWYMWNETWLRTSLFNMSISSHLTL